MILRLELFPIRKDVSSNQEIIELKKKVNELQINLNYFNNFYLNTNIIEPVNLLDNKLMCFSDYELHDIELVMFYEKNKIVWLFDIIVKDNKKIYSTINSMREIEKKFIEENKNLSIDDNFIVKNIFSTWRSQGDVLYYKYNKQLFSKIRNHKIINKNNNFMTEEFQELQNECIIFYNLDFTENIEQLLFLPDTIKRLVFVRCNISKLKLSDKLSSISSIEFYISNINNIDNLSKNKFTQTIDIKLFFTPIQQLNKSLFSSNFTFSDQN